MIDAGDAASRLCRHELAIRLLMCGLQDLERRGVVLHAYTRRRVDAIRATASAGLGADAFRAAERAGKAMSVADALELVLTLATAPGVPVSSR